MFKTTIKAFGPIQAPILRIKKLINPNLDFKKETSKSIKR